SVRVFEKPQPLFSVNRVCLGSPTAITDLSTLNPIDGEQIVSWAWDLDYDGVTFDPDPAFDNEVNLEHTYVSPGTYRVALRTTTNTGACVSTIVQTAVVDPFPTAAFTPSLT